MAGYQRLDVVVANNTSNDDASEAGLTQGASVQAFDQTAREAQNIRVKIFDFEDYVRSGVISHSGSTFVSTFQKQKADARKRRAFVTAHVKDCCEFFTSALAKIHKEEAVRHTLTHLADILEDEEMRTAVLAELDIPSVISALVSLLSNHDRYCMLVAGLCLGRVVLYSKTILSDDNRTLYLRWVVQWMGELKPDYLICLTESLKLFLRVPHYRMPFIEAKGLKPLTDILAGKTNFQLQYQVGFCLWMLSFESDIVEKMRDYPVVMVTADTLRATTREKVRRVIFAFYRNLLEKPCPSTTDHFGVQMVTYKVLLVLNVLVKETFQDSELQSDIEYLQGFLTDRVNDMSSFDEYAAEVRSGRLEWSPVHRSNKFWRENVLRLHENRNELLRLLVSVMEDSQNSVAIAVACHDVGEYVRHNPRGKRDLEDCGAKEQVMRLVGHKDPDVRIQALLALQKVMVQNWEYLGKQLLEKQ